MGVSSCRVCGGHLVPFSREVRCDNCLAADLGIPLASRARLVRFFVKGVLFGQRWEDLTLEFFGIRAPVDAAPFTLLIPLDAPPTTELGVWRGRITCPWTAHFVEVEWDNDRQPRTTIHGLQYGWTNADQKLVQRVLSLIGIIKRSGRPSGPSDPDVMKWVNRARLIGPKQAFKEFLISDTAHGERVEQTSWWYNVVGPHLKKQGLIVKENSK